MRDAILPLSSISANTPHPCFDPLSTTAAALSAVGTGISAANTIAGGSHAAQPRPDEAGRSRTSRPTRMSPTPPAKPRRHSARRSTSTRRPTCCAFLRRRECYRQRRQCGHRQRAHQRGADRRTGQLPVADGVVVGPKPGQRLDEPGYRQAIHGLHGFARRSGSAERVLAQCAVDDRGRRGVVPAPVWRQRAHTVLIPCANALYRTLRMLSEPAGFPAPRSFGQMSRTHAQNSHARRAWWPAAHAGLATDRPL